MPGLAQGKLVDLGSTGSSKTRNFQMRGQMTEECRDDAWSFCSDRPQVLDGDSSTTVCLEYSSHNMQLPVVTVCVIGGEAKR